MALAVFDEAKVRIASEGAAIALFAHLFAGLTHEMLYVAHLDADRVLIAERAFHSAHCDAVDFPLRAIIRDALTLDAAGLIIAHNHPSGDPAPSRADIVATRALVELARPLRIRLHDHLIFAGGASRSLHAMGLL